MVQVDITNKSGYVFDADKIRQVVEKAVPDGVTVDVSVVGEEEMKKLHKKYMETAEVTDVLSFPTYEKVLLGDIVICYPVAVKQAEENKRSVDEEMAFLTEHSCLHLQGIHHE